MKIRNDTNEYETPVTIFECEFCGVEFSVCPAVEDARLENWLGCLSVECASYDESRDIDKVWDELSLFGRIKHKEINQ